MDTKFPNRLKSVTPHNHFQMVWVFLSYELIHRIPFKEIFFSFITTNTRNRGYKLHLTKFGGSTSFSKLLLVGNNAYHNKHIHFHFLLNRQQ
ncbi:MAG: hypothetical protein CVU41_18010 [Chloroflexi bacterium HGW-Chloroflexi-3]|nr:MAG: hypothetical protein CVU41_18010 [Chloroflexi bacterium HGW-Chloroflexi-3]